MFFCLCGNLSLVFWLLARQIFTVYKYFKILHSDLLYFFFKKRLRYQIQEQAIFTFAQRRLLGKLFCEISLLKILVVEVNFYVNFLSSRKYDWNVAPRDLEKYGAPTAHASYFFKKN